MGIIMLAVLLVGASRDMGPGNDVLVRPAIMRGDENNRFYRTMDSTAWANHPIVIDGERSDWINNYTTLSIGVASEEVDLYVANDEESLYICIDAISDDSGGGSRNNSVFLTFDGDGSGDALSYTGDPADNEVNLDSWISLCDDAEAESSDGSSRVNCTNDVGYIYERSGENGLLYLHKNNTWADEWGYDWSVGNPGTPGHLCYEIRVPLEKWNWTGGDSISFSVLVYMDGRDNPIGSWPSNIWYEDPDDMTDWEPTFLATENLPPLVISAGANPTSVQNDDEDRILFTVRAEDPDGDISTVLLDLDVLGGADGTDMNDNGTHGDVTAGDGAYSHVATVPGTVSPGSYIIIYTVFDDHLPNVGMKSGTIRITVKRTNHPPFFETLNYTDISGMASIPVFAYEDMKNTYTFRAHDDDGDILTYSENIGEVIDNLTDRAGYSFDPAQGILEITPKQEHLGDHRFNIVVMDGNGGNDSREIQLSIINKNDPPEIHKLMNFIVKQDQWLNITPFASDEDEPLGDEMIFSTDFPEVLGVNVSDEFFVFSNETGLFQFRPNSSMVRRYETYIGVSDLSGAYAEESFFIDVTNENDPPGTPAFHHQATDFEPLVGFQAERTDDPDNDTLTYRWCFGDGTNNESGVDLLFVTHDYEREGTYIVTLTVEDNMGGESATYRTITVTFPRLYINVTGSASVPLAGANVTVSEVKEKGRHIQNTTDSRGQLRLPLEPGRYNITITAQGYHNHSSELDVKGKRTSLDIELQLLEEKVKDTPGKKETGGRTWFFCLLGVGVLFFLGGGMITIWTVRRRWDKVEPEPGLPSEFVGKGPPVAPRSSYPPGPVPPAASPIPPGGVMVPETYPMSEMPVDEHHTYEDIVPETTSDPGRKKPTVISEIWPEKVRAVREEVNVIKVTKKMDREDMQEIFGGRLPDGGGGGNEEEGEGAGVEGYITMETPPERTIGTTAPLPASVGESDRKYTSPERPPAAAQQTEITGSLKDMADLLKSFSEKK